MLLLQIIILMAIIFGGVVFVLRYVLTKNITSATSHLDQLNAEFMRREEETKRKQAEADRYYEEIVNRVKSETEQLKIETDRQLQEMREKILGDARNQSEQIIAKAEKTKEMMANEIRREIEAKFLEHLKGIILEVFPERVREEIHKMWLSDLLGGDLSRLSSMRIPDDLAEIKIVSAFPLNAEQKNILHKKFREQLARDVVFKEVSDSSLLGGLLITVGALVLDGTVSSRIEQVIRERV